MELYGKKSFSSRNCIEKLENSTVVAIVSIWLSVVAWPYSKVWRSKYALGVVKFSERSGIKS